MRYSVQVCCLLTIVYETRRSARDERAHALSMPTIVLLATHIYTLIATITKYVVQLVILIVVLVRHYTAVFS